MGHVAQSCFSTCCGKVMFFSFQPYLYFKIGYCIKFVISLRGSGRACWLRGINVNLIQRVSSKRTLSLWFEGRLILTQFHSTNFGSLIPFSELDESKQEFFTLWNRLMNF